MCPPGWGWVPLTEALPPQLEHLTLRDIQDVVSAEELFCSMRESRYRNFPKLDRLVISSPVPEVIDCVRTICMDTGIHMEVTEAKE